MSPEKLEEKLKQGIVSFAFEKLNGDYRPVRGTTKMDLIPRFNHPKGTGGPKKNVVVFYDLEKSVWRSLSKKTKFIRLLTIKNKN